MKGSTKKRFGRLLGGLLCGAMLMTLLPAAAMAEDLPDDAVDTVAAAPEVFQYADDQGTGSWSWASTYIYQAREKYYMEGEETTDGTIFRAESGITRAEAAAIATRIYGLYTDGESEDCGFADANGAWYTSVLEAAKAKSLVSGDPDGSFRPNDSVTRAEFAKMMLTAKGVSVDASVTDSGFPDANDAWYTPYVAAAKAAGLVSGDPDGSFRPNESITRAEAAVIAVAAAQSTGGGGGGKKPGGSDGDTTTFVYEPTYDESNVKTAVGGEILFFGDVHDYENQFFYYDAETGESRGVFSYLKNNDLHPGLYTCIGDYLQASHDITDPDGVFAHCKASIEGYAGTDIPYVSIMGNHEFDTAAADGKTGEQVFEETVGNNNYGLVAKGVDEEDPDQTIYYMVNFGCAHNNEIDADNTRADATNKYWVNPDEIEALDQTLTEIYGENGEKNVGVPTFINAHLPIHYYTDERSAQNNDMLLNVLNKYPYVIYVWGHNHSEKDPYYGTIKLPGDTIAPMKGIDAVGSDGTAATKEINFTYVPCGVVRGNQISDDADENFESALYVSVDGSKVTFTYCDRNGDVFDRMQYDVLDATYFEDFDTLDAANAANMTIDIAENADMTKVRCADFFLDRPVAGEMPSEVKSYSDRYETTITWMDLNAEPVTGAFEHGVTYQAEIVLRGDVDFSTLDADSVYLFELSGKTMPDRYVTRKVMGTDEGIAVIIVTFEPTSAMLDEPIAAADELEEGVQYAICSDTEQYLYTINRADCVAEDGQLLTAPNGEGTWTFEAVAGGYTMCSSEKYTYMTAGVNGPHTVLTPFKELANGDNAVWTLVDGALHISVSGVDYCLTCVDGTFALTTDTTAACHLYALQ